MNPLVRLAIERNISSFLNYIENSLPIFIDPKVSKYINKSEVFILLERIGKLYECQ